VRELGIESIDDLTLIAAGKLGLKRPEAEVAVQAAPSAVGRDPS